MVRSLIPLWAQLADMVPTLVMGDLLIAEPHAMIGFAGPRVIKETTHQDLPPGFQTAEFLQEHGLIDLIVPRTQMRATLANVLRYMKN